MVGLDAAGKTTILYKLKLGEGKVGEEQHSAARRSFSIGSGDDDGMNSDDRCDGSHFRNHRTQA